MEELLEVIAKKTNCFISDLKSTYRFQSIATIIENIDSTSFPASAWKETYIYMSSKQPQGTTNEAIKDELLTYLIYEKK